MMKHTLTLLILTLSIFWMVAIVFASNKLRACPNLKPVSVDEHFLFKKQPADGFYVIYASTRDKFPSGFTPRRLNKKALQGPHTGCFTTRVKVSGKEMLTGPPAKCSYRNPSAWYCETADMGAAGAAMSAAGVDMPKAMAIVIVDTDNKTFAGVGFCMDGAFYEWAIVSPEPNYKQVMSRTAQALSVSLHELKESTKRLKLAKTHFENGPCSNSAKLMAGVNSVKDGLTGVLV